MAGTPRIDLLIVNPGNASKIYQSLGETLSAIEPPIWAGLIATFVRNQGFSVAIVDANATDLGPSEVAEAVQEANPTLTAIVVYGQQPSASTQLMPAAGAICTQIKHSCPEAKTILLGGHVAALPDRTLVEEDADFVSRGEGLWTLVDLLQALSDSRVSFEQVRDLYRRQGKRLRVGPRAALVANLDEYLPRPAWNLLPMGLYRAHNWHCFGGIERQPYAALYTSLGCPFRCSFCCIQAPFKSGETAAARRVFSNSYRLWSPQSVIDQIDLLVNDYGVRNLKFADELFVLRPSHVNGICDLIIERGYDLNIWAYARVDTISDRMLGKLRRAGVTWLALGIEAASERVRKDIRKNFNQERVYGTIRKVKSEGMNIIGNYIFGLPEDDLATMKETLDLALELRCDFANFYCNMAYPGSDLYAQALTEGWPLPEDWYAYSQHSYETHPLPTRHLSAVEVLRFRDNAFQQYYTNEGYLSMIEGKFGAATRIHIEDMVNHKIARKLFEEDSDDVTLPAQGSS